MDPFFPTYEQVADKVTSFEISHEKDELGKYSCLIKYNENDFAVEALKEEIVRHWLHHLPEHMVVNPWGRDHFFKEHTAKLKVKDLLEDKQKKKNGQRDSRGS